MDLKTLAHPFRFAELDIRTATDEHSKIRFCAKDVCAALDIECSSHTLDNMPANRFTATKLIAIKDERNAYSINEAGLYHLIFRSNKPKPKTSPIGFAKPCCPKSAKPVSSEPSASKIKSVYQNSLKAYPYKS